MRFKLLRLETFSLEQIYLFNYLVLSSITNSHEREISDLWKYPGTFNEWQVISSRQRKFHCSQLRTRRALF